MSRQQLPYGGVVDITSCFAASSEPKEGDGESGGRMNGGRVVEEQAMVRQQSYLMVGL